MKFKEKIVSKMSPKLYQFFAGIISPFSAAIEGETRTKGFYKLGNYELDLLLRLKVIQKEYKTLEIGCGPDRIQKSLVDSDKRLGVYGTDFSNSMIKKAKRMVPGAVFSVGSGMDLKQYKSRFLNLVYSFVVFQHMNEEIFDNYLKESYRALKSGGSIVF